MGKLYDKLTQDYRVKEGLKACINCGTCTAICPAAEFYQYDPRQIVDIVQSKDDAEIEKLLKSETIWYCGECMSCITRCPRKMRRDWLSWHYATFLWNWAFSSSPRKEDNNMPSINPCAAIYWTMDTAYIREHLHLHCTRRQVKYGNGKKSILKMFIHV